MKLVIDASVILKGSSRMRLAKPILTRHARYFLLPSRVVLRYCNHRIGSSRFSPSSLAEPRHWLIRR